MFYFYKKDEFDLIYRFLNSKDKSKIFYPPQSLGDILLLCSLMKEYKKNSKMCRSINGRKQ